MFVCLFIEASFLSALELRLACLVSYILFSYFLIIFVFVFKVQKTQKEYIKKNLQNTKIDAVEDPFPISFPARQV